MEQAKSGLPPIPRHLTVTIEKRHGVLIIYCPYLLSLLNFPDNSQTNPSIQINSSHIFTKLPYSHVEISKLGFKMLPIKISGKYDMTDMHFVITKYSDHISLKIYFHINNEFILLKTYKSRETKSNYIVFA